MRILSDWLESYLTYSGKNEVPTNYHRWAGVWAISSAMGRKSWLDWDYFKDFPNMFIVLVGPPAAHKGTGAAIANAVVRKVEGISQGDDITNWQTLVQDLSTITKEEENGYRHSSLSLLSTEWSTFMGEKDKSLCNMLCKLYDCDDEFKKGTKTQGRDFVENSFLTMLACSTARQIGDCLPHAAIGGGFTSRIIFVVEDEARWKRVPRPSLSPAEKAMKEKLISDLSHINETIRGEFQFSRGAEIFYDEWHTHREELLSHDEKFQHYCDRKPVHVRSLAMILSAARGDSMRIGAGDIRDAIWMLEELEPRMPEALGGVGLSLTSPIISMVSDFIRKNQQVTRDQIQTYMIRDANAEELDIALRTIRESTLPITHKGKGIWIWEGR